MQPCAAGRAPLLTAVGASAKLSARLGSPVQTCGTAAGHGGPGLPPVLLPGAAPSASCTLWVALRCHSTSALRWFVVAPPAEDEALAALRILSAALGKARLRHLNLSDNALGEKGIRACAACTCTTT